MYHLITIFTFLTLSLSGVGLTTVISHEDWYKVAVGVSVIFGIATLIATFCMMFGNMESRNRIMHEINDARKYVKRVKESLVDLTRYKDEFKKILTEIYPEYEKEIFNNMAKNDAQQLEIMLVKYPELKFDGVLTGYIDGVKARLKTIDSYESYITNSINAINNINFNGWMLKKVTLPTDIQKLNEV